MGDIQTLANLQNVHEIKRIKNMLKHRSITKRKSTLKRSLRSYTRGLNRFEKQKRNLFRDLIYLRNKPEVTEATR